MSFTLTTDDNFENPTITVFHNDEEKILSGIQSFQIKHSTKGRGKGTSIVVSILTPVLNKSTHQLKCTVQKHEIPKDLDKILRIAEYWENIAEVDTESETETTLSTKV